jgi:type II secretory pathway predicted ATPase ExeA
MYQKYYSLTRKPFEMSPDPYFYLPTPLHKEAIATLYYRAQMRKGFVVLTGEVRGYIRKRLEPAGANLGGAAIFPDETIGTVYHFSQGIPRLVNTLCENALISGFGRLAKQVQPRMIQEVAADLRLELSPNAAAPTAMHFEDGNESSNC